MIALVSSVAVVSLSFLALDPVAFTARGAECYELPQNIQVDSDLRPAITALLARSRTLRQQCAQIRASVQTRVTLGISLAPMDSQARARAMARRYRSGVLIVVIEIPPASRDFAELVAHEFEHVTEFIDGVDFQAGARARDSRISFRRSDGSFESERARRAGLAAAAEVLGHSPQ